MSGLKDQVSSQGQAPRLSGDAEASTRPSPFAPPYSTPARTHTLPVKCSPITDVQILYTQWWYNSNSALRDKIYIGRRWFPSCGVVRMPGKSLKRKRPRSIYPSLTIRFRKSSWTVCCMVKEPVVDVDMCISVHRHLFCKLLYMLDMKRTVIKVLFLKSNK